MLNYCLITTKVGGFAMSISTIIMCVGIFFILISFFMKDKTKKLEKDVEELSINIYQEANTLKRRLKIVEEELLVDPSFQVQPPAPAKKSPMDTFQQVAAQVQAQKAAKAYQPVTQSGQQAPSQKPIHSILVSQVVELNKQGLSIDEISKRSTLSHEQIQAILNGGV